MIYKIGDTIGEWTVREIDNDGRVYLYNVCPQCGSNKNQYIVRWQGEEKSRGLDLVGGPGHSCIQVLNERLSIVEMELSKIVRSDI